jgi:hypothetical protein
MGAGGRPLGHRAARRAGRAGHGPAPVNAGNVPVARRTGTTRCEVGPGEPHTSLQGVRPLLNPGDQILVYGGVTYPGGVVLDVAGSATKPIAIRGGPGDAAACDRRRQPSSAPPTPTSPAITSASWPARLPALATKSSTTQASRHRQDRHLLRRAKLTRPNRTPDGYDVAATRCPCSFSASASAGR